MPDTSIRPDTPVARKNTIVAADAADEAILLDIDSGYFFQLNKSAARVWDLLEQPMSFADLCVGIRDQFAVDAVTCEEDVRQFVLDLEDRGILTLG